MPDQGSQTHSSGSSDAPSTRVENPAPNHANETQQRPVVVSAPQHAVMAATTPSSSLAGAPGPWHHVTSGPSYNAPGPSYNAPGPSYNAAGPSYNYFPQPASNVQYSATQYGPPGTSSHNPPSFFGCGPTQAQMTPCNYGGVAPSASVSVSPFSQNCSPQQPGSLMPYTPAAMYGPGPSSGVPIHGNGPHYWNNSSAQFGAGRGSPSPSTTAADRPVRRPASARSTGGKGKRPRDEGEPASGPPTSPELPERTDPDYDIPPNDVLCCDNCGLYIGRFVVIPCGHYGFCHRCLLSEKEQASKANRPEKCFACGIIPTKYVRCSRATVFGDAH